MDKIAFKLWLSQDKNFSSNAVNDVISRLNRGLSFLPDIENKEIDEVLMILNRQNEFQNISVSVKSQIRRALRLRYEYRNSIAR